MLKSEDVMQAIIADTAVKVVNLLDEEAKKTIFADAVYLALNRMDFRWKVSQLLESEAAAFAEEYIKKPEVQEQIKQKVVEAVEFVMDGLAHSAASTVQSTLRHRSPGKA